MSTCTPMPDTLSFKTLAEDRELVHRPITPAVIRRRGNVVANFCNKGSGSDPAVRFKRSCPTVCLTDGLEAV